MRGFYMGTLAVVLGIILGLGREYPVMLAIGGFTLGIGCLAILADSKYRGPERRRFRRVVPIRGMRKIGRLIIREVA